TLEGFLDATEQLATLFQGNDCVFEGWSIGIVGNGLDFGLLLRHTGLDGGLVVFILDFVEGWGMKGQIALREERIGGTKSLVCRECILDGDEAEGDAGGNDQCDQV